MSRPGDKPDWINDNTTGIEVPTPAEQDAGWDSTFTSGLKPPRQWFNWFMNRVVQWINRFAGQSGEYIVIDSTAGREKERDYETLAGYIADSPSAGDKVLVKTSQILTAQMVIPDNITLKILDGVNFTRSTLEASSVIKLGNNIIIEGILNLVLSQTGTTAKGIEIAGNSNTGHINVENSSTGTLTNAFIFNLGTEANRINGTSNNSSSGDITSDITDNSDKASNDSMIIDLEGNRIIPLHSHKNEKNLIFNGTGIVNQRSDYTLVKDVYDFGACDRFEGMATGTLVTAGILTQEDAANIGITGFAHKFSEVTITGTGIIYHRTRIQSKDAKRLKNQIASLSCKVYHDAGSAITYTLFVRKADVGDDFSAVTEISNDGGTSVEDATGTQLKFDNISMGDCSNGIEIELKIECGAITTKNFEMTEIQLEKGSLSTDFEQRSFTVEEQLCQRYATPLLNAAPAFLGFASSVNTFQGTRSFPVPLRAVPVISPASYTLHIAGSTYAVTISTISISGGEVNVSFSGTFSHNDITGVTVSATPILLDSEF